MPFTSPQAHIWDQFNVIDNACARANISDPSSGTVEFNVHTDQGTIREVVLSLKTFGDVLRCAGADVTTIHAQSTDEEGFRAALKAALVGASFVGLNFDHAALKMAGRGHFSPAAAYDAVSDRVLVLDVARYNYEPFWVSVCHATCCQLLPFCLSVYRTKRQERRAILTQFHSSSLYTTLSRRSD